MATSYLGGVAGWGGVVCVQGVCVCVCFGVGGEWVESAS